MSEYVCVICGGEDHTANDFDRPWWCKDIGKLQKAASAVLADWDREKPIPDIDTLEPAMETLRAALADPAPGGERQAPVVYAQGHGKPDHCDEHGDIPRTQSIASHLLAVHGLTYEQFQSLEDADRIKGIEPFDPHDHHDCDAINRAAAPEDRAEGLRNGLEDAHAALAAAFTWLAGDYAEKPRSEFNQGAWMATARKGLAALVAAKRAGAAAVRSGLPVSEAPARLEDRAPGVEDRAEGLDLLGLIRGVENPWPGREPAMSEGWDGFEMARERILDLLVARLTPDRTPTEPPSYCGACGKRGHYAGDREHSCTGPDERPDRTPTEEERS